MAILQSEPIHLHDVTISLSVDTDRSLRPISADDELRIKTYLDECSRQLSSAIACLGWDLTLDRPQTLVQFVSVVWSKEEQRRRLRRRQKVTEARHEEAHQNHHSGIETAR
jgi:hypothetical protein